MHLRTLLGLACCVLLPQPASAFCGFYVAGTEEPLYNDAAMVVLLREGNQTVLSMRNDYRGPPENFAIVIPVPEILSEDDVRTLDAGIFDRVDRLSAPRLVEYWEQDPCMEDSVGEVTDTRTGSEEALQGSSAGRMGAVAVDVDVEAEFAVGEYEIVILSAEDSGGLDAWLRANDYRIPDGAEEAIRPYVQAGMKFFVAKVDVSKVTFVNGHAVLSPLRIRYESDDFSLPVRLGMLNSSGTQDLIVHILANGQRYEVANYPNVMIPTNLDVDDSERDRFSEMYAAHFDATLERNPGSVVTEYAWQASECDACPDGVSGLTATDLATLGQEGEQPSGGYESYDVVVSRTVVQGDLSEQIVRRVTRRHRNELTFCQDTTAQSQPGALNLNFNIDLSYTITQDGRVPSVHVHIGGSEAFRSCVTNRIRQWTFPSPGNGVVRVRQRFVVRALIDGPHVARNRFGMGGAGLPKVLTRLHYRRDAGDLGEDLMFRSVRPINGGREEGEVGEDGVTLTHDSSGAAVNSFQARYVIRHEWTGTIECEQPVRRVWDARASVESPAVESPVSESPAVETPADSPTENSSGCGCRLENAAGKGSPTGWFGLGLLALSWRGRRAASSSLT